MKGDAERHPLLSLYQLLFQLLDVFLGFDQAVHQKQLLVSRRAELSLKGRDPQRLLYDLVLQALDSLL